MRHVLRRAPGSFSQRPPAAPLESLPARFLLRLLPSAYQPRRPPGIGVVARKSYRQRDKFLSQQAAARPAAEIGPRGDPPPQAGAPRLPSPRLERRMLGWPGTLLRRDL